MTDSKVICPAASAVIYARLYGGCLYRRTNDSICSQGSFPNSGESVEQQFDP